MSDRLKAHRTACPDIELVAAVQHPSSGAIETSLLAFFADERIGASEWLEPTIRVREWADRFLGRPNTANEVAMISSSYPTPDLWPWSEPASLVGLDGQVGMNIDIGSYLAPSGNGKGQTSAISEDWYTPEEYVAAVREVFGGRIDLDPASCAEANLTVGAENIFTAESDGLRHRWFGRVYLNPPWGRIGRSKKAFVRRALQAYESGEIDECILALNSNATTTAWFAPLFLYPICFPNHRVEHRGPGGKGGAPNSGTVFIYLGLRTDVFAQIFSDFGAVVAPLRQASPEATALAKDYEEDE